MELRALDAPTGTVWSSLLTESDGWSGPESVAVAAPPLDGIGPEPGVFDDPGDLEGELGDLEGELDEPYVVAYVRWLLDEIDWSVTTWMSRYALRLLQLATGVVFLWFGALKFVPGLSPAEGLVVSTATAVFEPLGFVPPGRLVIFLLAIYEVAVGLGFLLDRHRRAMLWMLLAHMASTALPLLVLPQVAWTHAPYGLTLEGQYIVKNLVLVAGAAAVGATIHGRTPEWTRLRSGLAAPSPVVEPAPSEGPEPAGGTDRSVEPDPVEDDVLRLDGSGRWMPPPAARYPAPAPSAPRVWIVDGDGSLLATYQLDDYYRERG
jgi:uncharacterized membrane protein YkgB